MKPRWAPEGSKIDSTLSQKWIPQSSLEAPRRVLGGLQNRLPKGPKSNPEGAKMASWRPVGVFWAQGLPQVAAKAALRPHVGGSCGPLGGSWGRLGAPVSPLGALLGLPGAPRRLAGELREVILERILKVDPGSRENHNVLAFLVA